MQHPDMSNFDVTHDQQTLTLLQRSTSGDWSGGVDRPSIMLITVSGTLVMSLHFSCQLGSFTDSISLAWKQQVLNRLQAEGFDHAGLGISL